jgi:NitT/TauT family transport system permease protein
MSDRVAPATQAAIRFRGGGFAPVSRRYSAWIAFAAVLLLWQGVCGAGWVSPLFLPSPAEIVAALWQLMVSGEIWPDLWASFVRIVAGWAAGTAIGLAVGLAMGLYSVARAVGMPMVSALFPIPKIALLPLLILWLGIGETSKIATIALGVFFPTIIAVYSGVDGVPRNLIRMAQSFEVPAAAIVWKVILPGAMPTILAGFRISAATALLLVVSAEMIGAETGLGAFVLQAGSLMQTDRLLAGVLILSLFGLAIGRFITALERRFLRWR